MAFDYTKISEILTWGTVDRPYPRVLWHLAEILNISYHLVDHPLLLEDTFGGRIDVFQVAMEVPTTYKNFNRTIIERTIYQANYFSNIKVDDQILSVSGKGIALALSNLKQHWEVLNNILAQSEEENTVNAAYIHHFGLIASGAFDAQLKFFLITTQELITMVIKGYISDQVKKQKSDNEKYEFLIKWRGDLQKQEEQFSTASFQGIMKLIAIELEVIETLQHNFSMQSGIENLVHNFLTSQKAQISNDALLKFLIEEKYYNFQESLKVLVMQLFSYHDITTNEPEKVYHSFLIGVFNSFSGVYKLQSNKEAGLGRFDILLNPVYIQKRGIIFEVKRSKTGNITSMKKQAYEAIEQIRENQYALELRVNGIFRWVSFAAIFYGKTLFIDFELCDNGLYS